MGREISSRFARCVIAHFYLKIINCCCGEAASYQQTTVRGILVFVDGRAAHVLCRPLQRWRWGIVYGTYVRQDLRYDRVEIKTNDQRHLQ